MPGRLLNICFVAPIPQQYDRKGHSSRRIGHWIRMVCDYDKNRNDARMTVVNTTSRWRSIYTFTRWYLDLWMYLSDCINDMICREHSAETFAETLQRATRQSSEAREVMRLTVSKEIKQSFDFRNNTARK